MIWDQRENIQLEYFSCGLLFIVERFVCCKTGDRGGSRWVKLGGGVGRARLWLISIAGLGLRFLYYAGVYLFFKRFRFTL